MIDALLAGVDSSDTIYGQRNNKGFLDLDEIVGGDDNNSIRRAFSVKDQAPEKINKNVNITLQTIKSSIQQAFDFKKTMKRVKEINKVLDSRKEFLPDSFKDYVESINNISKDIDRVISYGYEIIKDEIKK